MFIFKIITGVTKFTSVAIGSIIAITAGFAYATKPTQDMLLKDINEDTNNYSLTNIVESYILQPDIRDYVFFRIARITAPDGSKKEYLGAFQNWWRLRDTN